MRMIEDTKYHDNDNDNGDDNGNTKQNEHGPELQDDTDSGVDDDGYHESDMFVVMLEMVALATMMT